MKEIKMFPLVGGFAENKDIAREIRIKEIIPELERGQGITLNFEKINSATQSFIHALISDLIRRQGSRVLDKIYFKHCNETVQKIINMVVDYMQETD